MYQSHRTEIIIVWLLWSFCRSGGKIFIHFKGFTVYAWQGAGRNYVHDFEVFFFVEVCFIYWLSSRTNIISQTACHHSVANQHVAIIILYTSTVSTSTVMYHVHRCMYKTSESKILDSIGHPSFSNGFSSWPSSAGCCHKDLRQPHCHLDLVQDMGIIG